MGMPSLVGLETTEVYAVERPISDQLLVMAWRILTGGFEGLEYRKPWPDRPQRPEISRYVPGATNQCWLICPPPLRTVGQL